MHIVLLNGPGGAGKTTFADRFKSVAFKAMRKAGVKPRNPDGVLRIMTAEYKEPLIDMLFQFAESLSLIELGCNKRDKNLYRMLKDTMMLGRTGREWMITWSESMKKENPNVWVDFTLNKVRNLKPDVAVIADCGFGSEYAVPNEEFGSDNVTMFYFDGWQKNPRVYKHYEQFENDSRICLRGYSSLSDPTPEAGVQYIIDRIERAGTRQSALTF